MREITKEMIDVFKIKKLGFDFMGYECPKKDGLSFHHLIVPHRECKALGLGDGYYFWNGAILVQKTSHDYLHTIERVDPDMFCAITSEMIDENAMRRIEIENLRRIRDILLTFEREHCADRLGKNDHLIKNSFVKNRIKL